MPRLLGFLLIGQFLLTAAADPASAQDFLEVTKHPEMSVQGSFSIGPTRFVQSMAPGESAVVAIQLTSREGIRQSYTLSTEDFESDPLTDWTPRFYGDGVDGPYPARKWIEPEAPRLTLNHGDRVTVRVRIQVPKDAEPGDHQAALIVTRDLTDVPNPTGVRIVSRAAALFIITVQGDVRQEGRLERIDSQKRLYWSLPAFLSLYANNTGTVHMKPEGSVEIRNILGTVIDSIPIEDWIVLRGSRNIKKFQWAPQFALGLYTVSTDFTAFGQKVDPVSTQFWVIPLLPVLIAIAVIFILSFLGIYMSAHFELRRRDEDPPPEKAMDKK